MAPGQARAGDVLARVARLPLGDLDDLTRGRPALIVAPHPDDESLGCGGLIAESCRRGVPPVVVVLTDGSRSHPGSKTHPPDRLRALRRAETREAIAALDLPQDRLHFLDLPDGRAPRAGRAMERVAGRLAELAEAHGAGTILTTWEHDPHADHAAAHAAARRAAGLVGARLAAYPIWGWTLPPRMRLPVAAVSGLRLDVARHLPAKRQAIEAHATQHGRVVRDCPANFSLATSLLPRLRLDMECYLFEA